MGEGWRGESLNLLILTVCKGWKGWKDEEMKKWVVWKEGTKGNTFRLPRIYFVLYPSINRLEADQKRIPFASHGPTHKWASDPQSPKYFNGIRVNIPSSFTHYAFHLFHTFTKCCFITSKHASKKLVTISKNPSPSLALHHLVFTFHSFHLTSKALSNIWRIRMNRSKIA